MPLRKKLFWLFVAVFIMIVSYLWCIHRVYHFVPISTDIFIGNKIAGLLMKNNKICDNPEVKDRMDSILAAFAPSDSGFKYDITVINKNEVNAFALPGGKIFVFSGLLANTESSEEIAGVIAHEIAHIEKRHGVQNLIRAIGIHYIISMALGVGFEDFDTIDTLSEFSDLLIILKYSRGFEYEADVYGADILHRSGLSVAGLKSFMIKSQKNRPDSETIEPGENRLVDFLSTHPAVPRRIELLNQVLEKETVDYSDLFEKDVDWKNLSASCETPE
ncbi:MAG: M48 family metallopeptidase [Desulfosalsimonadaceae bacterium]|nr:M48 family metallopeptidase [Desulfosalsimonadaceae bacterium]